MGHTSYLTFTGLLGSESIYSLEAKKDGKGGSWGELALSYMATALGEVITVSSDKADLTPSYGLGMLLTLRVEKPLPLAKKTH